MAASRRSKQTSKPQKPAEEDQPATLKDLLAPEMLQKLKAQADELKADEARKREEAARLAEEARQAEQKRRENDFGYLLNNSKLDWKTYK
jgi:predicted lipid-binding transport protein (Tim44 family)